MKYSEYAERFKSICKESDAQKTQKELAKWLDYSQPMINYWINGEKLPSMDTAIKIADKFGVCVEWLMTGKGSKRSNEKPSSPILDKFNQLCPDQKREVTDFINFKLSQKTDKNQFTPPTEKVGGGGKPACPKSAESRSTRIDENKA